MDSLSAANSTFALNLFKKLSANDPTKNLFFSPLSISSALLIVSLGAKGNTEAQMSKVLSVSKDRDVHKKFEKLISEINKPGANYTLSLANRIFGETSYDLLASFIESTQRFYHAGLEKLNFKQASEDSRRHINAWVEEKTSGKIQNLLAPGVIRSFTKLVLVNAIYFKGNWADKFNPDNTQEEPFQINKNERKTVQMMFKNAVYNVAHIPAYRTSILEIPYIDNELSMIILLPEKIEDNSTGLEKDNNNFNLAIQVIDMFSIWPKSENVQTFASFFGKLQNTFHNRVFRSFLSLLRKQLEREITYEKLVDWINPKKMDRRKIEFSFPKFKLEEQYGLIPFLRSMGMTDAFDEADFSGMSTNNDLHISEVIHKSFIEVNEGGTEAAAATALVPVGCTGIGTEFQVTKFKVDHPFLFFIIQRSTDSILFFGRCCSP